jgi:hypothetical protein
MVWGSGTYNNFCIFSPLYKSPKLERRFIANAIRGKVYFTCLEIHYIKQWKSRRAKPMELCGT